MLDVGCGMQDLDGGWLDVRYGMRFVWDDGCGVWNVGCGMCVVDFW